MPAIKPRQVDAEEYVVEGVVLSPEDEEVLEEEDESSVPVRSSALQSGWAAAKKATDTGKYTNEFRFTEQQQLVKFLDAEPFAVFSQHWITRTGKKSFVCLGDGCPLCEDIGDTPRPKVAFSVVNLSAETPAVEILLTSSTLTRQLAQFDADSKTGRLDRLFWSMSKSGSAQKTVYSVVPVKPRDLADDWGTDIAVVEEIIDAFKPLDDSSIYVTSRSELQAVAHEITGK